MKKICVVEVFRANVLKHTVHVLHTNLIGIILKSILILLCVCRLCMFFFLVFFVPCSVHMPVFENCTKILWRGILDKSVITCRLYDVMHYNPNWWVRMLYPVMLYCNQGVRISHPVTDHWVWYSTTNNNVASPGMIYQHTSYDIISSPTTI